jgi:hypothetical protein
VQARRLCVTAFRVVERRRFAASMIDRRFAVSMIDRRFAAY